MLKRLTYPMLFFVALFGVPLVIGCDVDDDTAGENAAESVEEAAEEVDDEIDDAT